MHAYAVAMLFEQHKTFVMLGGKILVLTFFLSVKTGSYFTKISIALLLQAKQRIILQTFQNKNCIILTIILVWVGCVGRLELHIIYYVLFLWEQVFELGINVYYLFIYFCKKPLFFVQSWRLKIFGGGNLFLFLFVAKIQWLALK
eukprot:TRINITY_DN17631_c0_g2_i1.p4 TRINITY_DN17631_c0_g2~~TRINITY_DN17631_c0_g2_i1.p4  ORF type:complete len:145 (+),score=10.54 TRINITY_DN17631_c0_g2_i1:119-553(+)